MNLSRRKKQKFARILRDYPYSQSDLNKIANMDLAEEYVKVRKKESEHPRAMRDIIKYAYENNITFKKKTDNKVEVKSISIFGRIKKWIIKLLSFSS